ncbi:MAG: 1-acyl-sn-glycerol-3-phosphate acyltransferase [Clostridiales bacterium]|nr:1-acyl-sn-glycerol-3-phosphate acyltransferase [Clostridiales bacterium]
MGFYEKFYKVFNKLVTTLWRVSSEGEENIPDKGCLLICNHTSLSDVIVLEVAAKGRQIKYMAKKELFRVPLLNKLITALGAYPVDRGGADVKSIKRTIAMIESGDLIGMFPQGTRCPGIDPRTTEVKGGVGMIAYHAKSDILPVYIDNKKGKTKLFRKNHIIIGKPIKFEELNLVSGGRAEYDRAARMAFDKVCELKYGADNEKTAEKADT